MTTVNAVRVVIGPEEKAAVARVLTAGTLVQGAEVAAFESEFAELVGGRLCVAVNSGTSALHLSLVAAGIGTGDEVIVPSFTFAATANAVAMTGARPVFADIDPETFCMDPSSVASLVTPRTVGLVPVHLFGQMADMRALMGVAERHSLFVLEDAAQAHGATQLGRAAGSVGDAAAFSFYATKNMTTGEGGMVVTGDSEFARRVRLLRNQGMERRYHNEIVGLNNRMTETAAAIGRVQLRALAGWNECRRDIARAYDEALRSVRAPVVAVGNRHVYHQYTLRLPDRDRVLDELRNAGVEAAVYYPVPAHRLPTFAASGADLPNTEQAVAEVLSLPVHPHLTEEEVARVVHETRLVTETLRV